MFFVFRQVTWIPVRHSLKLQRENGIPVIAFDSNVAEKKTGEGISGNR